MTTKNEEENGCISNEVQSAFLLFFSPRGAHFTFISLFTCFLASSLSPPRQLGLQDSNIQGLMGGGHPNMVLGEFW